MQYQFQLFCLIVDHLSTDKSTVFLSDIRSFVTNGPACITPSLVSNLVQ